jgi:hypothetical protein
MSGFEVYSAEDGEGSGIDYEALNQYKIDTANLQKLETLVGIVTSIVDLGTQVLEDGEYDPDKGDEGKTIEELTAEYADKIEEGSITKFDMAYDSDLKRKVIKKFVPQKDRQAIVFSVDFPEVMLDVAEHLGGDSDPKALRLWMGGQFWDRDISKMVVNSIIPLKQTKDDALGWTMHPRSTLRKMAVASDVIADSQAFLPKEIDKLLGQSLQFGAQVFNKPSAKNGKLYYTENLKYVGGLARGQSAVNSDTKELVMFNSKDNNPDFIKTLPHHIINTMAKATNFSGSEIEGQLVTAGRYTVPEVTNDFESPTADSGTDEDEGF